MALNVGVEIGEIGRFSARSFFPFWFRKGKSDVVSLEKDQNKTPVENRKLLARTDLFEALQVVWNWFCALM